MSHHSIFILFDGKLCLAWGIGYPIGHYLHILKAVSSSTLKGKRDERDEPDMA